MAHGAGDSANGATAAVPRAAGPFADEIRPGITYRFASSGATAPQLFSVRFRVTRRCNRACRFCFIPYQSPTDQDQDVPSAIEQSVRAGARKIVLTGGEPTLHDELPAFIARACAVGAKWVELQTNGIRLADLDRCRQLADAGLTSVTVSLPSHREEVLEEITGVPRSLAPILRGLEHLAALGVNTSVTHVLNPSNVADVGAFVRFIWERELCGKLCFLFAAPIVPELARPEVVLRFTDGVGPLEEALGYCQDQNVPFEGLSERCGLPECLLAGDERYYGRAVLIPEANRGADFIDPPACGACTRRNHCYRVRALYAYLYGVAEFRPVLEPGVLGEAPLPTNSAINSVGAQATAVPRTAVATSASPPTAADGTWSQVDASVEPASQLLAHVGSRLELSDATLSKLDQLDTEWTTSVDVRGPDGSTASVAGWRVRYGARRGPTVGAMELSPRLDLAGCRAAAMFRGLRAAAFGLPMGGAHGGLRRDPASLSAEEMSEVLQAFMAQLGAEIGEGSDCITPHSTVPWDAIRRVESTGAEPGPVRWLRGKPLEKRGQAVRMPSVSSTVAAALFALARYRQPEGTEIRYAVWGFGRAGQRISVLLGAGDRPAVLVGCADSRSTCLDRDGLDAAQLRAEKLQSGTLPGRQKVEPSEILAADVDVLFITSRESPVDVRRASAVRARVIVDMTASLSSAAELALLGRDIVFVPASVATSGPMIAAAMELEAKGAALPFTAVERRIAGLVAEVVPAMLAAGKQYGLTMSEAVMALGMQALAD